MSDSPDEIASFEELAADPEIAALLDFEPVPRRNKVEGGWSPDKQREAIARLAVHGSAYRACNEMCMHRTGLTKVYNSRESASFRAAWKEAVELARRRKAERDEADGRSARTTRPPTIDRRFKRRAPGPREDGGAKSAADAAEEHRRTLDRLLHKYLVKLDCERKARREGDIIAADFYVRQLTWIEVALDICCEGGAAEAFRTLEIESADGRWTCNLMDISETPASRLLDDLRRLYWRESGEPDRPPPPPEDSLKSYRMIAAGGREITVRMQPNSIAGGPGHDRRAAKRKLDQARWAADYIAYEQAALRDAQERRRQNTPSPLAGEGGSQSEPGEGSED